MNLRIGLTSFALTRVPDILFFSERISLVFFFSFGEPKERKKIGGTTHPFPQLIGEHQWPTSASVTREQQEEGNLKPEKKIK